MAVERKKHVPAILMAHTYWDIVPVIFAVIHGLFIMAMFFSFPHAPWKSVAPFKYVPTAPWWLLGVAGVVYAFSISWNINGISHNFIHNPYFKSPLLNRLFSVLESLDCGFSQIFYDCVHRRHHMGNSDRPDADGETIDWISIYQHGHDGEPENIWTYTFLGYFREDVRRTYRDIKRKSVAEGYWGIFETALTTAFAIVGFFLNWRFMLYFLPFYYLGHCLSMLNGYFRHYGGNPDMPIAWGVSSYHWLYNVVWFNNGYHAEHHYRPSMHWTKMRELRDRIVEEQRKAGVRVIKPPHVFGFFDRGLREYNRERRLKREQARAAAHPPEPSSLTASAPSGAQVAG